MIPRQSMQTTKKQAAETLLQNPESGLGALDVPAKPAHKVSFIPFGFSCPAWRFLPTMLPVVLVCLAFLTGCTPPGIRAVLDGKKFLDQGDFARAIEELRTGT